MKDRNVDHSRNAMETQVAALELAALKTNRFPIGTDATFQKIRRPTAFFGYSHRANSLPSCWIVG